MVATDNLVSFKTLELCSLAGALVGVDHTVGPSFMDAKKAFRPFLPLKATGPGLFNCYEFCATDARHKPLHHPLFTRTESTCWIVIFITLLTRGDDRLASLLGREGFWLWMLAVCGDASEDGSTGAVGNNDT
jgi:hypothetical protein